MIHCSFYGWRFSTVVLHSLVSQLQSVNMTYSSSVLVWRLQGTATFWLCILPPSKIPLVFNGSHSNANLLMLVMPKQPETRPKLIYMGVRSQSSKLQMSETTTVLPIIVDVLFWMHWPKWCWGVPSSFALLWFLFSFLCRKRNNFVSHLGSLDLIWDVTLIFLGWLGYVAGFSLPFGQRLPLKELLS